MYFAEEINRGVLERLFLSWGGGVIFWPSCFNFSHPLGRKAWYFGSICWRNWTHQNKVALCKWNSSLGLFHGSPLPWIPTLVLHSPKAVKKYTRAYCVQLGAHVQSLNGEITTQPLVSPYLIATCTPLSASQRGKNETNKAWTCPLS